MSPSRPCIVAVVPIKRLRNAKSRLSPELSPEGRSALARDLALRVISALKGSGAIDRLAVVTPEPDLAAELEVEALDDAGDLNSSLRRGVEWAKRFGASSLLILPADLPLVTPADVRALVASAGDASGISICATRDGGTGALLLTPPDALPPSFGPGSFERHIALARERGIEVRAISFPAFEMDLDTAEDLEFYDPLSPQPPLP
jgi:2-phospho-L-lactate guanylyltransferase